MGHYIVSKYLSTKHLKEKTVEKPGRPLLDQLIAVNTISHGTH